MRYLERKEFLYDSEIFKRSDTKTALGIHAEYVRAHAGVPYAKFFEVDRSEGAYDDLWHMPLTERTVFSRTLLIPAIVTFEKAKWSMLKTGQKPSQAFKFWLANLHLMPEGALHFDREPNPVRLDYFPQRGDMVFHSGYRLMIIEASPDPTAYWAQTNVWLGITCSAIIAPEGDARPVTDVSQAVISEQPGAKAMPDWPTSPPTGPVQHSWP